MKKVSQVQQPITIKLDEYDYEQVNFSCDSATLRTFMLKSDIIACFFYVSWTFHNIHNIRNKMK